MSRALLLALLLGLSSPRAEAASRARFGGTLTIALTHRLPLAADPFLADNPAEATLVGLLARPLCRVDSDRGLVGVLVSDVSSPSPTTVRLVLRPKLRFESGAPLGPKAVLASLSRLLQPSTASPYRALLSPLKTDGPVLAATQPDPLTLELTLTHPWPDLAKSLCHPALAIVEAHNPKLSGLGPFRPGKPGTYVANLTYPEGRPYAHELAVTTTDSRGANRLLAQKKAHLALGAAHDSKWSPPALYATYLAFERARVGDEFRADLEGAIDRQDLARYFTRAPSVPMPRLLPPALVQDERPPSPPPPPARPTRRPPRDLTLLFDQSLDDHRAVAERLQLRLHERGYRVALAPLPRSALRARWDSKDYDLLLQSVLLPPLAAPALAVVLDAAGRSDLATSTLAPLGAIGDPNAREQRARELADALAPKLDLVPLFAQGLSLSAATTVQGLAPDAMGLPLLDALVVTED